MKLQYSYYSLKNILINEKLIIIVNKIMMKAGTLTSCFHVACEDMYGRFNSSWALSLSAVVRGIRALLGMCNLQELTSNTLLLHLPADSAIFNYRMHVAKLMFHVPKWSTACHSVISLMTGSILHTLHVSK